MMRCRFSYNDESVEAELLSVKEGTAVVLPDGWEASNSIPVSWITDIWEIPNEHSHG